MNDLVVLDRDGVINVDLMTYVTRPKDFEPIEGSLEAIALLNKKGFKIAIATNQACIEKNIITDLELLKIHNYMQELLSEVGGHIEYIAYCPHAPETNCNCRKPETGLLQEIESELRISLKNKYFIGGLVPSNLHYIPFRNHSFSKFFGSHPNFSIKSSIESPPILKAALMH